MKQNWALILVAAHVLSYVMLNVKKKKRKNTFLHLRFYSSPQEVSQQYARFKA